ncbi:uncharacterized protein [Lolium perenne]|uniref:uncharacterized protein isoform X3 n=1 Tax=Lolium perenne TaxID=4522 RepID=UPI0021F6765A|nr:uncharacterized protein LOC127302276 isoform X3 [Lolium perenne]
MKLSTSAPAAARTDQARGGSTHLNWILEDEGASSERKGLRWCSSPSSSAAAAEAAPGARPLRRRSRGVAAMTPLFLSPKNFHHRVSRVTTTLRRRSKLRWRTAGRRRSRWKWASKRKTAQLICGLSNWDLNLTGGVRKETCFLFYSRLLHLRFKQAERSRAGRPRVEKIEREFAARRRRRRRRRPLILRSSWSRQSEVDLGAEESMSTVNGARRVCKRHSQDESADKVVVNLVSPAPGVASRRGVSASRSGARTSPIDVEALDDEVQVLSASQVPPRRRNPKIRRQPVAVVDLEVHATREVISNNTGNKRQRASAVIDISPETGEGSSLQSNKAVKTRKEPAKVAPKEPIFTCPVCWNKLEEPATTMCGHIFCTSCIKQAIQVQKKCPTCRKYLKINNFHRIYLPNTAG